MPEGLKGWHLDSKIPVGLILALLVQTLTIAWWASSLSATVDEHSRKFDVLARIEDRRASDERTLAGQIARIKAGLTELTRTTARIEAALGRTERQGQP